MINKMGRNFKARPLHINPLHLKFNGKLINVTWPGTHTSKASVNPGSVFNQAKRGLPL